MLVGRQEELSAITAALVNARAGRGVSLCFKGTAGIGKTSLLDAAEAAADGFHCLRVVGVPSEFTIGHAGLAEIVAPLRGWVDKLPAPQRSALEIAIGWSAGESAGGPFLVGAATVSLMSLASRGRPVLLLVDDLQWIDRESVTVLMFAARRLRHDAVAVVLAQRGGSSGPELPGISEFRLSGLDAADSAALLSTHRTNPIVIERLIRDTGGNPLALLEAVTALSPAQLRGSAALPPVLPVGQRLTAALLADQSELSAGARRALVIAAASSNPAAGPVVAALRAEGVVAEAALLEAERAGALTLMHGALTFRHPLIRAAVWNRASPEERRSAHGALAIALRDRPAACLRHRAEAAIGFDDQLAADLSRLAVEERSRLGYAASSALFERTAQLTSSGSTAAHAVASAVEDAVVSGDVNRARALAKEFEDERTDAPPQATARVLLGLGILEQNSGSVPAAATLLRKSAELGTGIVRLRALVELAQVNYRLGTALGVADAAVTLASVADLTDPEQEMLACYTRAAALAFAGNWQQARPPGLRALEILESEPALRDDPRYLAIALLAAGWVGEPARAMTYMDRRIDAARARGAIGVLPLALDLIAAGAIMFGRHELSYACAGEVVELGVELGYFVDVGSANTTLAVESAARGRHDDAARAIAEAKRLSAIAGVAGAAVQVHLAEAFCALCRGDWSVVVEVLERRLDADEGRLPRGDYPLSVAPDLIEAYLALGRRDAAQVLAARHATLHSQTDTPDIRAMVYRISGMVDDDHDRADQAFRRAHDEHVLGPEPLAAARTRLLHGSRLRRAGRRTAAREQLRIASDAFRSMGLNAWTARTEGELAATGAIARRAPVAGGTLTSQETRVALMVARGQTNRGIAAALFLSPKTVEHHITTILRKRGLRSRTELAVSMTGAG